MQSLSQRLLAYSLPGGRLQERVKQQLGGSSAARAVGGEGKVRWGGGKRLKLEGGWRGMSWMWMPQVCAHKFERRRKRAAHAASCQHRSSWYMRPLCTLLQLLVCSSGLQITPALELEHAAPSASTLGPVACSPWPAGGGPWPPACCPCPRPERSAPPPAGQHS